MVSTPSTVAIHLAYCNSRSLTEIEAILPTYKGEMRALAKKSTILSTSTNRQGLIDIIDTDTTNADTFRSHLLFDTELQASAVYTRGAKSLRNLEEGNSNVSISAIVACYMRDTAEDASTIRAESKRTSYIEIESERGQAILAGTEWATETEDLNTLFDVAESSSAPTRNVQSTDSVMARARKSNDHTNLVMLEKTPTEPILHKESDLTPIDLVERSKSAWSTLPGPTKLPKLKIVFVGDDHDGTTDLIFHILNQRPRGKRERVSINRTTITTAMYEGMQLKVELLDTSNMDAADRLMDTPYDRAACVVYGFRVSSMPSFNALSQKVIVT